MKVKNESVTKKTTIEHEDEEFLRIEGDDAIIWSQYGKDIFEYNRSRQQWQQRIKCNWYVCPTPEIEKLYVQHILFK